MGAGFSTYFQLALRLSLVAILAACSPLAPREVSNDEISAHSPVESNASGEFVLLDEGPDALETRLLAIDSATESIDLQTFLWFNDTAGTRVLAHLRAAADRGVEIRILVDDSFLLGEESTLRAVAKHPQISYRIYNPFKVRAAGFNEAMLLNAVDFKRLNHRMHNKAMIVDGRWAIVGGRNLADEYFGFHDKANFRDLELLVRGPAVTGISTAYEQYWNAPWSFPVEDLIADGDTVVLPAPESGEANEESISGTLTTRFSHAVPGVATLIADNPPTADESAEQVVAPFLSRLFDSAEEEIVILSAYLIPTPELGRRSSVR